MQNLISILDIDKSDILSILELAHKFKNGLKKNTLANCVIGSCFFEASTRTRLSFEAAVMRLGGKVIGFADSSATSLSAKGESLVDTFKIISSYVDALILRHPMDGAARLAQEVSKIPVINAGDGANQHPSQTLLDLFAISEGQGMLDGINLGLMGDLKFSRTVHSLVHASRLFKMNLFFIAPVELRINDEVLFGLKQSGINYSFHTDLEEVIDQLDCLYLTRVQKERFIDIETINFDKYQVTLDSLKRAKPNLKILHPLPRQDELPVEIDKTPYAHYFEQASDGVFVRQALLDLLFT